MQTKRHTLRSRIHALVSTRLKRRLLKVSKAEDRSMSAVLEDLMEANLPDDIDLKVGPGKGKAWVAANKGLLKGKFTRQDYDKDDLLGYLLRKHAS